MSITTQAETPAAPQTEQERLWTVTFIATLVVSLFVNISGSILINLLPLFTVSLGGNNLLAGSLTTILTFSAFFFRPFTGRQLDIRGRKLVLMVGLSLFAAASLALVAAKGFIMVLLCRLVQGIGLSGYSTALGTIVSDIVPKNRISEGLGYFGIAMTLAAAIGPVLGLALNERFGFQITFAATFFITLISIACAFLLKYEKKSSVIKNATPPPPGRRAIFERTSVRPCIVMFINVFAISAVFSFMSLFAKARGIEDISLFFPVYAVSTILVRLFTGKFADRFGHFLVLIPALAISLFMFLFLAFADSLPMVLIAAVLYGAGYGTVQPVMNTLVIQLSPPERKGAANATYYMFLDIGFGLGSLIWGGLSQVLGFEAVFLLCAACIALSVIAYFLALRQPLKEAGIR